MTHELYLKCVIACLVGNILHIMIACLNRFKDNKSANIPFSVGRYIRDDKWVFLTDAVFSFAVVYLFDEWSGFTPWFVDKAKTFFVFVGFSGSYVLNSVLSVSKKKFQTYVDVATDVAEGKKGSEELQQKPNQDLVK
jgi:hypothetical protein